MPRVYRVTFEQVLVAGATNDLIQIVGAASRICRVKRYWLGNTNTVVSTAQQLATRCRFLPATVTNGSGGTTPTPQKLDPGDANATFTALVNNTTKATTSGTAAILDEQGFQLYAGLDIAFQSPPIVGPLEAFVFELLSTVAGTVNISGGLEVEEIGG